MKELTFTSYEQYLQYMEHKAMEKAVMKGLQDEELATYKKEFKENVMKVWNDYDCDYWLEKHGYVVISVWKDGIGGRKLMRGRPKKLDSEKFKHTLHVRLDDETYNKFCNYCEENNLEKSEAIREMIKRL
ncbi:ribbon-helix-helix protein, CopG family [Metabacillus sp. 22489]|uniref:ribbon-helix-helix protein, CopG family n=1 Tax=Metabacillus sp. 22489 TaxID=3453928 RepID=UPI003F8415CA